MKMDFMNLDFLIEDHLTKLCRGGPEQLLLAEHV